MDHHKSCSSWVAEPIAVQHSQYNACEDEFTPSSSIVSHPHDIESFMHHDDHQNADASAQSYVSPLTADEEEEVTDGKYGSSHEHRDGVDLVAKRGRRRTSVEIESARHQQSSSAHHHHSPPPSQQPSQQQQLASRPKQRRPRHSSRRSSLGETTQNLNSQMAKLDTFLRASSLRLKEDGTCSFLFEGVKFEIEASTYNDDEGHDGGMEETGEFLFYCSLGKLHIHRRNFSTRASGMEGNLLRMLSFWNEELQQQQSPESGLLRIDSSKADGPHVSFIYYGNVGEIGSAEMFQEYLDQFVDDALEFHGLLNEGGEDNVVEQCGVTRAVEGEEQGGLDRSERSCNSRNKRERNAQDVVVPSTTSSAVVASEAASKRALAKSFKSTSTASMTVCSHSSNESVSYRPSEVVNKINSPSRVSSPSVPSSTAQPTPSVVEPSRTATPSPPPTNNTTSKKTTVFSKVMSTLKRNNDNSIGAMAFIDPSNPSSAFVIDKNNEEKMMGKPTINISRKGVEKVAKQGSSFHGDDRDMTPPKASSSRPSRKVSSFHIDDNGRNHHRSSRNTTKGSSFHIDDHPRHVISKRSSLQSFHEDDSRPVRKTSSSFHHIDDRSSRIPRKSKSVHKRGSYEEREFYGSVPSNMNHNKYNNSFNPSVDVFNNSEPCDIGNNSRFNHSELLLSKSRKSSYRANKSVHPERNHDIDHRQQQRINSSSEHRRKTPSDVESRAMKSYHQRQGGAPPSSPPPSSRGGKWSMERTKYDVNEETWEDEGQYNR